MATQTLATASTASPLTAADPHRFPDLPAFPTDIQTAPLHRPTYRNFVALRKSLKGEQLLNEANQFFDLGPKLYDLRREELQKYDYKNRGSYIEYKGFGNAVVDEHGNLDWNEFYNMTFSTFHPTPFSHPQVIYDHDELIKSYIKHSHALVTTILSHLNTHLHLPPNTLQKLHRLTSPSGDQIRVIKSPPQPVSDRRTALGKHTDFGSITLLFNRLGGLQILPPPSLTLEDHKPQWTYVKPIPSHCIVNHGDSMVKFTRGVLRSNIHRVVSPPGEQACHTRYSVFYFSRANDEVILKGLGRGDVILRAKDGEEESINSKD
ncbi:hypothetical protein BJ875DRAFT_536610 [Amylocarpus encephaloides]|uniref:Fe2OG dioxygenase domain-containing protein n=1 Tax=Amylocarpus encephaloides TaxID=45428 RepID=A0A9P7YCS7_9HELO|nr:hypothetical protein BJ875DRAFT_536610 [Amylocarpus encephaloides]